MSPPIPTAIMNKTVQEYCCRTCGKSYYRPPSARGKFCSTSCYAKSLKKRVEIKCLSCGSFFYPNLGRKKFCSKKCHGKAILGELHPRWNNFLNTNTHVRTSQDYRLWSSKIKKRDNYTCQICGTRGVKLQTHHIIKFSVDEKLRTKDNNAITLCKTCHFLRVNRNEPQWESYFNFNLLTRGLLNE